MSDFYSVLKQTIIDRGLRSESDREAAYAQARTAMIRRLWSFDPPLAEDEIDGRIGQFDLAVERIESDVIEVFARSPEPVGAAEADIRDASPPPALPIYDGYDQDTDYTPAFGGTQLEPAIGEVDEPQPDEPVAEEPEPDEAEPGSFADLLASLDVRSLAVEQALNADPDDEDDTDDEPPPPPPRSKRPRVAAARPQLPAPVPPPRAVAIEADDEDDYDDDPGTADEDAPIDAEVSYDVPVSYYEPARDPARYVPIGEDTPQLSPVPAYDPPDYDSADYDPPDYDPPADVRRRPPVPVKDRPVPRTGPKRSPGRRVRGPRPPERRPAKRQSAAPQMQSSGGGKVALLLGAVGALAIALIVVTAYILWPSPADGPVTAVVQPPAGGPAPAAPPGSAAQRFTVFDGTDPTVFNADPSNPIRFNGSVARISTTAASAGARALIGPGLAIRLAGHTIRVTIMARAAEENGAVSLRFAYQSGLAVSHWQSSGLTNAFAPIELVWRVPTLRTDPTGNAILIEPGIPGDGTGVEISAIAIDLLD